MLDFRMIYRFKVVFNFSSKESSNLAQKHIMLISVASKVVVSYGFKIQDMGPTRPTGRSNNSTRKLTLILFIIYLIGLSWLIVLKFNVAFLWIGEERSVNFIPFIEPWISHTRFDPIEMILNTLVFVPFGIYTGILFKNWRVSKHALIFSSFSLICEALQYILAVGAADVTDIINNTLGGLIGLFILKGIDKIFLNEVKTRKFINITSTIATALIISLLLYLRINELWLFLMYSRHK